jgi:hypothetical protein
MAMYISQNSEEATSIQWTLLGCEIMLVTNAF